MFQEQSAVADLIGGSPGESAVALDELRFNPGFRPPGLNNFPMRMAAYLLTGDFFGDAAERVEGESSEEFLRRCFDQLGQAPRGSDFDGYSRRYLVATATELNSDIADALQRCGTSSGAVLLFDSHRRSGRPDDSLNRVHQSVFAPLYKHLRALGYSHRDLTE